jgi:hypothetical protein
MKINHDLLLILFRCKACGYPAAAGVLYQGRAQVSEFVTKTFDPICLNCGMHGKRAGAEMESHAWAAWTSESDLENKREEPQSHEDREAQKLVTRIEKTLASEEADREAETKRTLDDYGKKVGS